MALSVKQKAMLKVLEGNFCNVSAGAKSVGIDRQTHYNWLVGNRQYSAQYKHLEESLLDRAETFLHEQIEVTPQLLQFFLKTKGKSRGYSEKMEIEHSGEVTGITLNIVRNEP